jgi:hypothetical protein
MPPNAYVTSPPTAARDDSATAVAAATAATPTAVIRARREDGIGEMRDVLIGRRAFRSTSGRPPVGAPRPLWTLSADSTESVDERRRTVGVRA